MWSTKDTGSKDLRNDRIPYVNEKLSFTIFELKGSLPKSSRTSRLWINYMNHINIVKNSFICTERTDNLHLFPIWLIFSWLLGTDTTKTISMVIYQICWRGLSFNLSWQSRLGVYMDWSCHRSGLYVIHWCIRCIHMLKSITQCQS